MEMSRVQAAALYEEARQRWETGNASGALARLQRCLEVVETLDDRRWQAELEREVGQIHYQLHQVAEAMDWYDRARARFASLADPAGEGWTLIRLGEAAHLQGDYGAARARFEEALPLLRAAGDPRGEGVALGRLGQACWEAGDAPAGLRHLVHGLALLVPGEAPEAASLRDDLHHRGRSLDPAAFRARVESATTDAAVRAFVLGSGPGARGQGSGAEGA
jgi:tetratricopeptide (TPR) repeat protein